MCLLNSNHMNYLDIAVWATLPLFPNHPLYPSAFKEILAKLSSSQNYSNIIESLYQSYTSSTANKNCQNMIAKL